MKNAIYKLCIAFFQSFFSSFANSLCSMHTIFLLQSYLNCKCCSVKYLLPLHMVKCSKRSFYGNIVAALIELTHCPLNGDQLRNHQANAAAEMVFQPTKYKEYWTNTNTQYTRSRCLDKILFTDSLAQNVTAAAFRRNIGIWSANGRHLIFMLNDILRSKQCSLYNAANFHTITPI